MRLMCWLSQKMPLEDNSWWIRLSQLPTTARNEFWLQEQRMDSLLCGNANQWLLILQLIQKDGKPNLHFNQKLIQTTVQWISLNGVGRITFWIHLTKEELSFSLKLYWKRRWNHKSKLCNAQTKQLRFDWKMKQIHQLIIRSLWL